MKKILALACALVMLLSLAMPAMAETSDMTLEEITLAVKQALDISDDFTSFQSNHYNGNWDLSWSSDDASAHVTSSAAGEILSYYYYENNGGYQYTSNFVPRYPSARKDEIAEMTQAFLGRVLGDDEWVLDDISESLENEYASGAYVTGRLIMNGHPTDISINVSIDLNMMRVTSYYRSDSYMRFDTDALTDDMNITGEEARALLRDALGLSLEYRVVTEGEQARLVYLRKFDGTYIVRAADGELINVDEMYSELYGDGGYGDERAYAYDSAAPAEMRELTEVELAGISAYDDALSAAELDAAARAVPEIGITEDFALTSADYYNYDDALMGNLNYSRKLTESELKDRYGIAQDELENLTKSGSAYYLTKHVTLDAKTGEMESLYTSHPYFYNYAAEEVDAEAHRDVADAFIEKYFPALFDQMELSDARNDYAPYNSMPTADYYYVRMHNGYAFDANYFNVTVNAKDGTIDGFYQYWNDGQEFEETDAGEIIAADEAYDAYFDNLTFEAAYISVPKSNDYGEYLYERVLAWHFVENYNTYGVDAVTGEVLRYGTYGESAQFIYTDTQGAEHQEAIEKLAMYGVGFSGGKFEPERAFSVRDMLTLLLMADGYRDIEGWDYAQIASTARSIGAPDLSGSDPDEGVTRGFFAGMLVDMCGLGDAAKFEGIYAGGFADDDAIDPAEYGRIALAYGMGLIAPDAQGMIDAGGALDRAGGAQILHNFLNRGF